MVRSLFEKVGFLLCDLALKLIEFGHEQYLGVGNPVSEQYFRLRNSVWRGCYFVMIYTKKCCMIKKYEEIQVSRSLMTK
jgi:hypothetical protein